MPAGTIFEVGSMPGGSARRLYMISKGDIREGFFGRTRSRNKAVGNSLTQSRCNSKESLVRVSLSVRLVRSTFPEDWG